MSDSSLKKMEPSIDARVRLTIRRIQEEMETRGAVDVYKWWMFMSTDVIGELCFGDSFRMLEHGKVSLRVEASFVGAVAHDPW